MILILSLGASGGERLFLGWMLELSVWKEDSGGAACVFFQKPGRGPMETMGGKFFLAADPQVTASGLLPALPGLGPLPPPRLLPLHVAPLTEQTLPPLPQGVRGQAPR